MISLTSRKLWQTLQICDHTHTSVHLLQYMYVFAAGLFVDPSCFQSEPQHSQQTSYQTPGLKRLGFVRSYGTYYSAKIASIYGSSRRCVPHSWRPQLQTLEEHVSSASSPLRWGLHIRSEQLLWALDSKVPPTCIIGSCSYIYVPADRCSLY